MGTQFKTSINEDKCIQCRLCFIECPSKTGSNNDIRSNRNSEKCDGCLHCYSICPESAIEIEGYSEDVNQCNIGVAYNDLLNFLKLRRSIRKYKPDLVPDSILNQLTESAKYIPSGGNAQELSITIIKNTELRSRLESEIIQYYDRIVKLLKNPLIRFLMKFSGDPKVKATAKDKNFFEKIKDIYDRLKNGGRDIFYDAPVIMIFHTSRLLPTAYEDSLLAAYHVMLSAHSHKLGTCFVSLSQQAIAASKKIKKLIHVPPEDFIYAVIILGFPAVKYRRNPPRIEKNINLIK
ncbi:MAG TPA: 4Fe-4S dicluster domain-containing protein [Salinimicrobium catena]|uniref:4Fe-4S dicluster domain-containing protein n=1 Tax=Salinimicrobium catena TaxID=390640 RepID=A0A7C2M1K6_9FLAO|nr:4Fe-4S dicluster domain-containing protein [Salinimicrobium catena]